MKIILTSLIGAVILAVMASISTVCIIDLHKKAETANRMETEHIEKINKFIIEEGGFEYVFDCED